MDGKRLSKKLPNAGVRPNEQEEDLHRRRDQLLAMPSSQRQLITMVFRKLLASSTFAIAGTLETLVKRLKTDLASLHTEEDITEAIAEDFESLDEIKEEWAEGEDDSTPQIVEENREDKLRIQLLRAEIEEVAARNNNYFEQELEKVDKWAEDLKESLEITLKELDAQMKALKREARLAADLQTKVDLRRKVSELEKQRHRKRRDIFDAQDEIESRKEGLIAEVEARLKQKVTKNHLFTIRWIVN